MRPGNPSGLEARARHPVFLRHRGRKKELEEAIIQAFSSSLPGETGSSLVAINARHQHELGLCREHVRLASESISRQESPEFTALELREALTHLGEITGAVDTEDVLGAIFSSFCLGK